MYFVKPCFFMHNNFFVKLNRIFDLLLYSVNYFVSKIVANTNNLLSVFINMMEKFSG